MGINWKDEAKNFILAQTGQRSVVKAMQYLDNLVYGDVEFVNLVAKAMEKTYTDAFQTFNKASKANKKEARKDETPAE